MSDNLNFSDDPIDVQTDFDSWEPPAEFAPPPPAATYQVYVDQIRDAKEFDTKDGKKRLSMTLDFRVIGGEYDNRAITWQRLTNAEFERKTDGRRTSLLLDLIKSAGVTSAPRSNNDFYKLLVGMKDAGPGQSLKMQIDWRGFCSTCYEKSLMSTTGMASVEDAKQRATSTDYDAANKAGNKAKNYRAFPMNPNGTRKDSFVCPDCGEEVRASVRISRFLI